MFCATPALASAPVPDTAEQTAYQAAVNMAEPGPRAAAMEAFAAKYTASAKRIDALEQAMAARQVNNEPDKVDQDARKILALRPDNARALAIDVVLIRAKAVGPTTPQTKTYADDAAAEADKGLKALATWKPPEGATDTEVANMRNQMTADFNGALGFRALIHADYAAFRNAFRQNARKPSSAAAHIENIVGGLDLHQAERGLGDGPVVVLHRFALARIGPAIEFFSQVLLGFWVRH